MSFLMFFRGLIRLFENPPTDILEITEIVWNQAFYIIVWYF